MRELLELTLVGALPWKRGEALQEEPWVGRKCLDTLPALPLTAL